MVILRPTQKLKGLLPAGRLATSGSDTALGDWYVSRFVVDRRPLLILVSSLRLLPLLVPARDVRILPVRLRSLVEVRLTRLGTGVAGIKAEIAAMADVVIGQTLDRSVLGIMADFVKSVPFMLEAEQWGESALFAIENRLAETPCFAGRSFEKTVFPDKKAPELIPAKWGAG